MNEKDKNEMLEAILSENEAYQCKLWAVIMAGADTYALIGGLSTLTGGAAAALGALSNAYCYLYFIGNLLLYCPPHGIIILSRYHQIKNHISMLLTIHHPKIMKRQPGVQTS